MKKSFPPSIDALYEILDFIRPNVIQLNFDKRSLSKIELACEEAIVNIITYAKLEKTSTIEVSCEVVDGMELRLTLIDHGIPYNPLNKDRVNYKGVPIEERIEGGHGIDLILDLMDEVKYERKGELNRLTLIKNLKPRN